MDEPRKLSKSERKKARRRQQKTAEQAGGRELDQMAELAVAEALRLAPEVADAATSQASERVIDVPVTSVDAARFARKRINEALATGEWLDVVQAWVWQAHTHARPPLSDRGRETGVELRLEQPRASP